MTREPTEEEFNDEYLRTLTEVYHKLQCRSGHPDQCAFLFSGWEGSYEQKWGPARSWMGRLLAKLDVAEAAGMTIEQFVNYELIGVKQ